VSFVVKKEEEDQRMAQIKTNGFCFTTDDANEE
jgi:hypothetical protein